MSDNVTPIDKRRGEGMSLGAVQAAEVEEANMRRVGPLWDPSDPPDEEPKTPIMGRIIVMGFGMVGMVLAAALDATLFGILAGMIFATGLWA